MKKIDVVLGLQWGDEGKGKVVDVLTPNYKVIARFQGGPNAGHSLHFGDTSFVLRMVPSGIFREGSINIIGNGVVVDPVSLTEELCKKDEKSMSVGLWNLFADSVMNPVIELDQGYASADFYHCSGRLESNRIVLDEDIPPFGFAFFTVHQ